MDKTVIGEKICLQNHEHVSTLNQNWLICAGKVFFNFRRRWIEFINKQIKL